VPVGEAGDIVTCSSVRTSIRMSVCLYVTTLLSTAVGDMCCSSTLVQKVMDAIFGRGRLWDSNQLDFELDLNTNPGIFVNSSHFRTKHCVGQSVLFIVCRTLHAVM